MIAEHAADDTDLITELKSTTAGQLDGTATLAAADFIDNMYRQGHGGPCRPKNIRLCSDVANPLSRSQN